METFNVVASNEIGSDKNVFICDNVQYVITPLREFEADKFSSQPTVVFVDWLLNDMSGLEMCRRLRSQSRCLNIYIVMVLEAGTGEQRSRALAAGADNYVTGPLDLTKLQNQLQCLARCDQWRESKDSPRHLPVIDRMSHRIGFKGRFADLSRSEFRILEVLLNFPRNVVSRMQVIEFMLPEERPRNERTVDQWIARLRTKLSAIGMDEALRTVRDKGYILDTDVIFDGDRMESESIDIRRVSRTD